MYYCKPFLLVIIEYRCRSFFPQRIPGYLSYFRHCVVDIYIGLISSLTSALFFISNFSDRQSQRFNISRGTYMPPSTRALLCTHQHRSRLSLTLPKQGTDCIFSPANTQLKFKSISRNYESKEVYIDEIRDTLLQNMATWHIEYFKPKEFEKTAEGRRSL